MLTIETWGTMWGNVEPGIGGRSTGLKFSWTERTVSSGAFHSLVLCTSLLLFPPLSSPLTLSRVYLLQAHLSVAGVGGEGLGKGLDDLGQSGSRQDEVGGLNNRGDGSHGYCGRVSRKNDEKLWRAHWLVRVVQAKKESGC